MAWEAFNGHKREINMGRINSPKEILKLGPISIWTNCIGRPFTIDIVNVSFHIFPRKEGFLQKYWQWGYMQDWYDGPLHLFGLGPLLLVCW